MALEQEYLPSDLISPPGLFDARGRYVRLSLHALKQAMARFGCSDYAAASQFLVAQWRARERVEPCSRYGAANNWYWHCPSCTLVTRTEGAINQVVTVMYPRRDRAS